MPPSPMPIVRVPDRAKPPEPWEDGLRLDPPVPGTVEWWYFDAQLSDGSTVVIAFLTKQLSQVAGPLQPVVALTITRPDGLQLDAVPPTTPQSFAAAVPSCDVKIGPNWARGDLKRYELHAEGQMVSGAATGQPVPQGPGAVDLVITGIVPAWRPDPPPSDIIAKSLGWFPPIPYGTASGTITYNGQAHSVTGTAYHDHDWIPQQILQKISHWFWGRAHVGDYTIIYSKTFGTVEINYATSTVLLLAKGSRILIGDGVDLNLWALPKITFPDGGNYIGGLAGSWNSGANSIRFSTSNPVIIEKLQSVASGATQTYARFVAAFELNVQMDGAAETVTGMTLYEVMILNAAAGAPTLAAAVQS